MERLGLQVVIVYLFFCERISIAEASIKRSGEKIRIRIRIINNINNDSNDTNNNGI